MIKTNKFRLLTVTKDGGPDSHVHAYWLIGWKKAFSIVLLKFSPGSRDAYHTHAFNSVSWVLRGRLYEHIMDSMVYIHKPSLQPVLTYRSTYHKVVSLGTTWVLSFRGPWSDTWKDLDCQTGVETTLTHGRIPVTEEF